MTFFRSLLLRLGNKRGRGAFAVPNFVRSSPRPQRHQCFLSTTSISRQSTTLHQPGGSVKRTKSSEINREFSSEVVSVAYLLLVYFLSFVLCTPIVLTVATPGFRSPRRRRDLVNFSDEQRLISKDLVDVPPEISMSSVLVCWLKQSHEDRLPLPHKTQSHYRPLTHRDEIRVLVLHPGKFEDDIVFHLDHIVLSTSTRQYEALSYAWGDAQNTRSIYTEEGRVTSVTENLLDALQHLRLANSERILWIDAICIDQSDLEERNQQVRIMGNVFAKADRVLIWLGRGCDQTSGAFKTPRYLYANTWQSRNWYSLWTKRNGICALERCFITETIPQHFLRVFEQARHETISQLLVEFLEQTHQEWLESKTADFHLERMDWADVCAILQRPWFHRLWVIQEVSQARRAVLLCGKEQFSWTQLAAALTYLVDHDLTKRFDTVASMACNTVINIEGIRRRKSRMPLFDVVLDNAYSGCTDPRDKIFAMMSLSEGYDEYDWEISLDYSMSVEELYKRFAIWDIVRNKSLRTLSCATFATADHELLPFLPSWAPDWSRLVDRNLLIRASGLSGFSAGTYRPAEIWITHDKSLLNATGAIIDSVYILGQTPCLFKSSSLHRIDHTTIAHFEEMQKWLHECWNIAKGDKQMTKETFHDFWQTMLCGLDRTGRPASELYARFFLIMCFLFGKLRMY